MWDGFQVGDYVIADHAMYDVFAETWIIYSLTRNLMGQPLVRVHEVGNKDRVTVFYPHELSYEDGTRPSDG